MYRPITTISAPLFAWPARVLVGLILLASPAVARDLEAVADGEHLWLIMEDPAPEAEEGSARLVYHSSIDATPGALVKLDPIPGKLMPRGLAAGDDRLLMVGADRRLITLRPAWSKLLDRYMYDQQTLGELPEGCTLLSIAIGSRGPWALVLVEDASLLAELEPKTKKDKASLRQLQLNRALGLPNDYEWPAKDKDDKPDAEGDQPTESSEADEQDNAAIEPEAGEAENELPDTPVRELRLIRLQGGRWVSVPLPAELPKLKHAVIVMSDDDARPTLVIESEASVDDPASLIRYSPVASTDKTQPDAWAKSTITLRPSRLWSAAMVEGQAVLAVETGRSLDQLYLKSYVLRGDKAIKFGDYTLPTQSQARWAALPWRGGLGAVVKPGPKWSDELKATLPAEPMGALMSIGLNSEPIMVGDSNSAVSILHEPPAKGGQGNADLIIQIITFASAMVLMLLFYRQAPRPEQIDLPEDVVLAGFWRRFIAGFIDLGPGFFVAGAMYDTTVNETMLYWPGNGIPKVVSAMMPGFVVIVVTITHTTIFEAITARSMGKWLTGLYVADLSGKPAEFTPCVIRSLSRVFDLFAPLIIVVALISPARQRLGDILAKTTVMMKKPEPPPQDPNNNEQ